MANPQIKLVSPSTVRGAQEEEAYEFFKRYEAVGAYSRWKATHIAAHFKMFLDESAQKWYNYTQLSNVSTDGTTEVSGDPDIGVATTARESRARKRFLTEFQPLNDALYQEDKLRHRLQVSDEPVIAYYYDVLNLCRMVNPAMAEKSRLDYLFHGLEPSLSEKVYPMKPRDCKEFLEFLKPYSETAMTANTKSWSASVPDQAQDKAALTVAKVETDDSQTTTSRNGIMEVLKLVHQMINSEDEDDE